MKRITFLLVVTLAAFLGITFLATRNFARIDKQDQHVGHQQAQGEKKAPKVDGSQNPALIPDIDAQEILFKILSASNPNDKQETQRKKSFLRVNGFNDGEAAAIAYAAYEYKRQIDPLDAEVDSIKKQHWPNPSANVRGQLAQLQRQKEIIIADSILSPLKVQLRSYDQNEKLDKFLVNEIKKKTKGFAVEMPTKKISSLQDHLSNFFSASAQAGGCDTQLYVYSTTWVDYDDGYVYCDNSYSSPYNNCGHTYTLSWSLNNLASTSSISLWGSDGTGTYQSLASVEGYCEQAFILFGNGVFAAGNNSSQTTVAAYVEITGISLNGTALNNAHANVIATATFAYTAGASGKTMSYHPGFADVTGVNPTALSVTPNTETSYTVNTGTMSFTYSKDTSSTGSFKAYCIFKPGTVNVLGATTAIPKTVVDNETIQIN